MRQKIEKRGMKGVCIRMRKNRIAVILSAILALSGIGRICYAFPGVLDDVPEKQMLTAETSLGVFSDADIRRAYRLLDYLDIISEKEEEFDENAPVSRAYAVSAFAAILAGSRKEGSAVSFSDVPQDHAYAAGIYQATEVGILDGAESKFYPNKNASFEDIARWALKAIGFDASLLGRDPVAAASGMGIFKGVVAAGSAVTKGQFMRVLENTLNCGRVDMNMSEGGFTYKQDSDRTNLGERYGVYLQEGIVTGYKYSSLYGDIDLKDGEVEINRAVYTTDEKLTQDIVGYNVSCYIDGERNNRIVTLWKNGGRNNTYEVFKEDGISFDEEYIRYGNSKRVSVSGNIRMLKNNVFDGYYAASRAAELEACDKIAVIDNDGDGKGDLLKAYKYSYYIVRSVSVLSESVVFGNDEGTLDMSDGEDCEFRLDGELIDPLTDLKPGDVLTATEGTTPGGRKVFSAEICRDSFDGTIEMTGSDDKGEYYVIEGAYYYLSDNWISYMTASSSYKKVGDYVQVFLATDGKVVSVKSEGELIFGYLMEAKYKRKTDELVITVFRTDGENETVRSAEKVRIYNETYQDGKKMLSEEAYGQFFDGEGNLKDTAVGYTLDRDGKLRSVVFEVPKASVWSGTSYPLTLDLDYSPDGKEDSRAYHGLFARKWTFDGSIPVITVPTLATLRSDAKAYSKTTGNKWGNGEGSYLQSGELIKGYNSDKFWRPEFYTVKKAVTTTLSQGGGSVHFYVIDKICDVFDEEEGASAKVVSYYDAARYKETKISDEVSFARVGIFTPVSKVEELSEGDIIQIHTDALGDVDIMAVYFRIQAPPASYGSYYYDKEADAPGYINELSMEAISVVYGKVVDIDSNKALIRLSGGAEYPVTIGGYSSYGTPNYLIYDKGKKTATPAALSDIKPDDIVVMRKYYNHVQDVIVIKN